MYVARRDMEYLRAHMEERMQLLEKYRELFGEGFVPFNYETFPDVEGKLTAELYLEALREAVETGKPYTKEPTYERFGH
ncbi:MAG: hypothetical protein PHE09_14115 [Oscillospiraceae bacterium]|nr:hypothetical protein [Oscillospiraceae bacterium]